MTLEELLDLTVEIPNTCHLVRHAENVPIGITQTTPVLYLGSRNFCSDEIVTQNVPPYRRQHSDPTTQAEQLPDDSLPLIYHYISLVRLFLCCDLIYTQIATRGRGHVHKGVHVPGQILHALPISTHTAGY